MKRLDLVFVFVSISFMLETAVNNTDNNYGHGLFDYP